VVIVGVTTTIDAVVDGGSQLYIDAPVAVRVVVSPKQSDGGAAIGLIVGFENTVKLSECVLKHPFKSLPISEYVVVIVGLAEMVCVNNGPGLHV